MSESLFTVRDLTVAKTVAGIQISVGDGHDFRSENLSDTETKTLALLLLWRIVDLDLLTVVRQARGSV